MLMIRLQRVGRKHEPVFRLVLTDSKNGPKSGKYVEVLGSYDARRENKIEQFKVADIKAWIGKGAQLSTTVHNFLVSKKIIEGKKINALPKKKPIVKEASADAAPAASPASATPAAVPTVEAAPESTPAPEAPVAA